MNKTLAIIKKSVYGSSILEEVFEASSKLSSLKSYSLFSHYYDDFYASSRKLIGYHRCLQDLNLISWEDSQDFLELIYRYTDIVHRIASSHILN